MVKRIAELLDRKGRQVWTVGAEDTVLRALELMEAKNIGAVVVVDQGRVIGMFTERHYARKVILKGRSSPKTKIREVMRTDPIFVRADQSLEDCMAIMASKNLRHLPVLEDERLEGIVSMGDLLRFCISAREYDIEQLVHYIRGAPQMN